MISESYKHIDLSKQGSQLTLYLNQPKVRNAMSLAMVAEITQVFHELQHNHEYHIVVIRGRGGFFSAGADLKDITAARSKSEDASGEDPFYTLNRAFGTMITAVNSTPQTVVAVLEGAALGGGFGLACVADIGICHKDCYFGLPETGLGVIPAQIAPFVVKRIGLTQARWLALTGHRFQGAQAVSLGIAHILANDSEELEQLLEQTLARINRCAPFANRATKDLLLQVEQKPLEILLDQAARSFARAVRGQEAIEGMEAFLAKRPPQWNHK